MVRYKGGESGSLTGTKNIDPLSLLDLNKKKKRERDGITRVVYSYEDYKTTD